MMLVFLDVTAKQQRKREETEKITPIQNLINHYLLIGSKKENIIGLCLFVNESNRIENSSMINVIGSGEKCNITPLANHTWTLYKYSLLDYLPVINVSSVGLRWYRLVFFSYRQEARKSFGSSVPVCVWICGIFGLTSTIVRKRCAISWCKTLKHIAVNAMPHIM